METFEIRVIGPEAASQGRLYACHCASAFAAIRRAKALARPGETIEVWHGMQCLFSTATPEEVGEAGDDSARLPPPG